MQDLRQIELLANRYTSRSSFLSEMTLDPPQSSQDYANQSSDEDDYLILSTIHSAKGLEWDAVYVIHASDGNIPSSKSLRTSQEVDEELRLFFVALTRAKDHLYITYPLCSAGPRGNRSLARLTRFLPQELWQFCHRFGYGHPPTLDRSAEIPHSPEAQRQRKNLLTFWNSPPAPRNGQI